MVREAAEGQHNYFEKFGDRMPAGIWEEHHALSKRLHGNAHAHPEADPHR